MYWLRIDLRHKLRRMLYRLHIFLYQLHRILFR
jgi:hypothetical protein